MVRPASTALLISGSILFAALAFIASSCAGGRDHAFERAVARNDFDTAKRLLSSGANINRTTLKDRETVLMLLSASPDTPAVDFLINNGADLGVRNRRGWTAVMYAAMNGQVANIRRLAQAGADMTVVAADGRNALAIARAGNHVEAVDELTRLGVPDLATKDSSNGRPPG